MASTGPVAGNHGPFGKKYFQLFRTDGGFTARICAEPRREPRFGDVDVRDGIRPLARAAGLDLLQRHGAAERSWPGYRAVPWPARARPRAAARVPAQLRHGVRAARAVRGGAARARPAAGGAQRPFCRCHVAGHAGRRGAEAGAAGDHRGGLRRGGRAAGPGAAARQAGRRGVLRVEPVRGRAADHRPVGTAARLRRPAVGAAGGAFRGPGAMGLDRAAVPVAGARGDRGVRRDGDHRPGRGPGGAADVWRSPGRRRARRPGRRQPAVARPVAAARGVRGPRGRGGVRGPGRHAVRHRREPGDAGRRVERADRAEGLRRGVVGAVAGHRDGRAGRLPGRAAWPAIWAARGGLRGAAPLAGAGGRGGSRAADRLHRGDFGRTRSAAGSDDRISRGGLAARRAAVRGAACPPGGHRFRSRGCLGDEPGFVRDDRAEAGAAGWRGRNRSGDRGLRAGRAGAAGARAGVGRGRAAPARPGTRRDGRPWRG